MVNFLKRFFVNTDACPKKINIAIVQITKIGLFFFVIENVILEVIDKSSFPSFSTQENQFLRDYF